jgi:hypothetical protein
MFLQLKSSLSVMLPAFTRGLRLVSYRSIMQPFHCLGRDLAAMPILITDYFVLYKTIGFYLFSHLCTVVRLKWPHQGIEPHFQAFVCVCVCVSLSLSISLSLSLYIYIYIYIYMYLSLSLYIYIYISIYI